MKTDILFCLIWIVLGCFMTSVLWITIDTHPIYPQNPLESVSGIFSDGKIGDAEIFLIVTNCF